MSSSNPIKGSSNKGDDFHFDERAQMRNDYDRFLNTVTLGTLFVAPILIAMPPRKLDFYTFSLGSAWFAAASYRNLPARTLHRFQDVGGMPRAARDLQERERLRGDARESRRLLEEPGAVPEKTTSKKTRALLEDKAKEIWMGGETEGWKERRLREERERLAKGETYGSMIMDQIWEVWNWGGKSGNDADGDRLRQGPSSKNG
ncbi:uncharacterized protein A1O9_10015 [Exophiala aquamarina CBS 119918]|uniref:Uncharacterized protein n=1 Tax=Exophiala aquamarina CBS 119918 TaxID=1182545 RepID=A0A072P267_9EURO|nr:uncharacterized protein A1O9_10015 [Exophiala aquamarina CBS 119918]KEF54219.1 hypothetical protein A1O9_10015 [Exophiala aquamarina CBS 119918]